MSTLLHSINPATGEALAQIPTHSPEEVDARLARAAAALRVHRQRALPDRARFLRNAADLLEKRIEHWARLLTLEMGKPLQPARDEVMKCARTLRYYAEHGPAMLAPEPAPDLGPARRRVEFQPLGTVLAVMPWNFPLWQVFRAAGPALLAGNTMVLKHASNVPQSAQAIEEIWREAGLKNGEFATLLIGASEVARVIADPRIHAVTLTGSDAAGAEVASAAGRALKKCVLELGGSDPFIVMPSSPLDPTVEAAVKARIINNGESCIAAKRFIVHESIAAAFETRMAAAMARLRVGDPLDPATQVGPLATSKIRDQLQDQVERTVRAGARVLTGGRPRAGAGNFYEPTVLTNLQPGSPAWHEEFFGPVALVIRARDLTHAIEIANDNPYGLGSSLWSADPREHEQFVRDIEAGQAFINTAVSSDAPVPFGGVKRSGYGRELGIFGIREFTNIKTVVVSPVLETQRPTTE